MMQYAITSNPCNFSGMDEQQEATRDLVRHMVRVTGLEPSRLAREAGLSPTTLTRFLNDQAVKHTLSARSLSKLSAASGVPVPTAVAKGCSVIPPDDHALPGLRFRALCELVWRTSGGLDKACKDLGITRQQLDDIAAAKTKPDENLLYRLCAFANCPPEFIASGDIRGVRTELGVWLGHLYPHLIPALRDEDGDTQA